MIAALPTASTASNISKVVADNLLKLLVSNREVANGYAKFQVVVIE